MMIDEIRKRLRAGNTKFGSVTVKIDTGGIGGRYRAFIETPTYNTMCETPDMVDKESLIRFIEDRLTYKLAEILSEFPE